MCIRDSSKGKIIRNNAGEGVYVGANQDQESIIIARPAPKYSNSALKSIQAKGQRSVACWVVGEHADGLDVFFSHKQRVPFSINPLPQNKQGGRNESEYRYADDTRDIVNWDDVLGCEFSSTGSYLII